MPTIDRQALEEVEAALEPFATDADAWEKHAPVESLVEAAPGYSTRLTVAHLRNARAALARLRKAMETKDG